jgi:hypothetical protein
MDQLVMMPPDLMAAVAQGKRGQLDVFPLATNISAG